MKTYSELDPEIDEFLNNIISGQSNVPLMQKRAPLIQREAVVNIEAPRRVPPITEKKSYANPVTEDFVNDTNRALIMREDQAADMSRNRDEILKEQEQYKYSLKNKFDELNEIQRKQYESDPEIESKIQAGQQEYESVKDPERNISSELILSLAPALSGLFLGESGMISQAKAGQDARNIYEGMRKQDIEAAKAKREALEKRVKTLIEAKKSGKEGFDNERKIGIEALKAQIDGNTGLIKATTEDVRRFEDMINKVSGENVNKTLEAAKVKAGFEGDPAKEKAKDKRAAISAAKNQQGKDLNLATGLRKEFTGDKQVQNFQEIESSYNKVREFEQKPSAAGDLSMIFAYMKMLDPASTVREGEFATAQQAAGVPERVITQYNKILKGERLSPDQRKDFVQQARNLYNAQLKIVKEKEKASSDLAKSYGVDPNLVVTRPAQAASMSEKDKAALDWANKNPKDPRAAAIKQKLGVK